MGQEEAEQESKPLYTKTVGERTHTREKKGKIGVERKRRYCVSEKRERGKTKKKETEKEKQWGRRRQVLGKRRCAVAHPSTHQKAVAPSAL